MSCHRKVLVVDDDENIRSAFKEFLNREHCSAVVASSAEEALQKVELQEIDLVITDVKLEAQSGVTLFMKIKAERPELPVIVITGYPNLIAKEELRILGADYLFVKPLELDKLREAVRRCLHLNSGSVHKD